MFSDRKILLQILAVFALLLGVGACTKGTLDYRIEQGVVVIRPDWTGQAMAAGTKYHFYSVDGSVVDPTPKTGTGEEMATRLPTGRYMVVGYNTDSQGVIYDSLDNYHKALVHAEPTTGVRWSRAEASFVKQPENVFSIVIGEIDVVKDDTVKFYPAPTPLVKTAHMKFTLDNGATNVARIDGALCGIYRSVNLLTCKPSDYAINTCPDINTNFIVDQFTANVGIADITFFGLHNPMAGTEYQNVLTLKLTDNGGGERSTQVDLSNALTEILESGQGGVVPIEIDLDITIKVIDGDFNITVKPWDDGGHGEGNV